MEREPRSFLWDVQRSADKIFTFLDGVSEEQYLADEMLQAAVERHFMTIGEALAGLSKINPELAARIPDFGRAVAFRNLLVHGYAVIKSRTVWLIAQEDLPVLRKAVEGVLFELDGPMAK